MDSIAQNLQRLRGRIEAACGSANRSPESVTLIGVSKTKPAAAVREAAGLGLTQFGENYLDEALDKINDTRDLALEWHYIGRIQSNKTRQIAAAFQWVHTIDRAKIAQRLQLQCAQDKQLNVLMQVNIDDDPAKGGVSADQAPALLEFIATQPNLRLRGLMTILASGGDARASYESVAQLAASLAQRLDTRQRADWDVLSMGMTADMEHAIAAGATHIRIGTALFGARTS